MGIRTWLLTPLMLCVLFLCKSARTCTIMPIASDSLRTFLMALLGFLLEDFLEKVAEKNFVHISFR